MNIFVVNRNVNEVSGRSVEVRVCSQWLTLVGEAAEEVAHLDMLSVAAAARRRRR
jgi:hypothetical protein